MNDEVRALIVEDSTDDATQSVFELTEGGFQVYHRRVDTSSDMRDALTNNTWDIILCDYSIPNFGAMPALNLVKELKVDIPFIVLSGVAGEETAVEAMAAGAHDFIIKDNYSRLVPAVRREIEGYTARKKTEAEVDKQRQPLLYDDHAEPPAPPYYKKEHGCKSWPTKHSCQSAVIPKSNSRR